VGFLARRTGEKKNDNSPVENWASAKRPAHENDQMRKYTLELVSGYHTVQAALTFYHPGIRAHLRPMHDVQVLDHFAAETQTKKKKKKKKKPRRGDQHGW
jgi:hypothetical protein